MFLLKAFGLVLVVLLLVSVGLVVMGQLMNSFTGYIVLIAALSILSAIATFRIWGRRDSFNRELDGDFGGETWGRVRTRREPGIEEERMTK